MRIITYIFLILIYNISFGHVIASVIQPIKITLSEGNVTIDPNGLKVSYQSYNDPKPNAITAFNEKFSTPQNVIVHDNMHEFIYDNFKILVSSGGDSVNFKLYPIIESIINWPNIIEASQLESYLIPEGEGLYIPVKDRSMRKLLNNKILNHGGMLPFVGLVYKDFTLTIIEHTPYRNTLNINPLGKGLTFEYDYRKRDNQSVYEISFTFSKSKNLLTSSKIFRSFLKNNGQFVTLEEKIKYNPEIQKLAGSIHMYIWGDGRSIKFLKALENIDIKKAWIGYEEKPTVISTNGPEQNIEYVGKNFIELAVKMGYLVGAYDSYHTMQSPKNSDCYNDNFGEEFFPKGCVRDSNNNIVVGFAGRGCYVSMKALDNDNNQIVNERISKFKLDGINSYFLDCHGALEAYDDYSLEHPQTIFEDISIRLKHLDFLSKQRIVLGSESATVSTIPFLAFSHGTFSTLYDLHWPATKNKKYYGGWYPGNRPAVFFKTIKADAKYSIRYNPQYRLPLFQAVFHDSIVTTDRWEIPLMKFSNLYKERCLLELLYGVPSIWNLDLKAITQYKPLLRQLSKEFAELHPQIMTKELTNFEYLTTDRKVQKTIFGNNEVIIIGNFKDQPYEDIPTKSLKIIFSNTNHVKIIKIIDL